MFRVFVGTPTYLLRLLLAFILVSTALITASIVAAPTANAQDCTSTTTWGSTEMTCKDSVNSAADLPDLTALKLMSATFYTLSAESGKFNGDNIDITVGAKVTTVIATEMTSTTMNTTYTVTQPITFVPDPNGSYYAREVKVANCVYNFVAAYDANSKSISFTDKQSTGGGIQCIDASSMTGKTNIFGMPAKTTQTSTLDDAALNDPATYTQATDCNAITDANLKQKCMSIKACKFDANKPIADCIKGFNTCATSLADAAMVSFCAGEVTKGVTDAKYVPATAPNKRTCAGGALGFFLCPLATMMNDINNWMAGIVNGMLRIDAMTKDSSRKGVEAVWQMIVGFANLALFIAFLIVIFSQATSIGLSAYGIKKMLPRIIAAAILLNLSFFLCSALIDIFNVIGASMEGLFNAGVNAIPNRADSLPDMGGAGHAITDLTGLLEGLSILLVTVVVIVVVGAIGPVVTALIMGTISFFLFFMAIALRQVLVVLLVIAAPLAFAAMILPNTEQYFKKWWSSLLKLLLMYPAVAAIMYGSYFVAQIMISQIPDGWMNPEKLGPQHFMGLITAYLILALGPPLGSMWYVKNSNSIISKAAGGATKAMSGAAKGLGGLAQFGYNNSRLGQTVGLVKENYKQRGQQKTYEALQGKKDEDGNDTYGFYGSLARRAVQGVRKNDSKGLSMLEGKVLGAERAMFNKEVDDAKLEYATKYDSKEAMLAAVMKGMENNTMDSAHMKAAMEHIAGFSGGGTVIDTLARGIDENGVEGAKFAQLLNKNRKDSKWHGRDDPFTGFSRSLGGDFAKGSPDIAALYAHHGKDAMEIVAQGKAGAFTGENWVPGNEVEVELADASGAMVKKKFTINQGAGETNVDGNGGYAYHAQRLGNNVQSFGKAQAAPLQAAINEILSRDDGQMAQELAAAEAMDESTPEKIEIKTKAVNTAKRRMSEKKLTIQSINSISEQQMGTIKDPKVRDVVEEAQKMVARLNQASGNNPFPNGSGSSRGSGSGATQTQTTHTNDGDLHIDHTTTHTAQNAANFGSGGFTQEYHEAQAASQPTHAGPSYTAPPEPQAPPSRGGDPQSSAGQPYTPRRAAESSTRPNPNAQPTPGPDGSSQDSLPFNDGNPDGSSQDSLF